MDRLTGKTACPDSPGAARPSGRRRPPRRPVRHRLRARRRFTLAGHRPRTRRAHRVPPGTVVADPVRGGRRRDPATRPEFYGGGRRRDRRATGVRLDRGRNCFWDGHGEWRSGPAEDSAGTESRRGDPAGNGAGRRQPCVRVGTIGFHRLVAERCFRRRVLSESGVVVTVAVLTRDA
jgi:hypothetical protein